ncbi:capsid protein [Circoviridae sp.]|nr:capsid protein [Circoviridae sp.]
MPRFRRKRYGKRYRKRYRKSSGSGFASAYKAVSKYTNWPTIWSAINNIRSLINVEHKYVDTSYTTAISSTGALTHLTSIAQGNDVGDRGGNSVKLTSLFMRGDLTINASATISAVRIMVFIWNDNTAPVATDLLDADNVNSNRNLEKSDKIRVICDKRYNLIVSTEKRSFPISCYSKLHHHLKFTGAAGTTYESGSIWLYVVSSEATNTVANTMNFRIKYLDN